MDTKVVQRSKRRGWIKNAAIIFLAIMLVLTFFSNTIMNRSLPEVATKTVSSGTISAKIRGSGTVTANSAYEVKIKENRVIKTVAVRKGDVVEIGDILFFLSEGDSTQLEELKKQLDEKNYSYRLLLLSSPYINYVSENRNIQTLKDALEDAINERDLAYVTDSQITTAEIDMNNKETALKSATDEHTALSDRLIEMGTVGAGSASADTEYKAWMDAQAAVSVAQIALDTAKLVYENAYNALILLARAEFTNGTDQAKMAAYVEKYPDHVYVDPNDGFTVKYSIAFETIQEADINLSTAQNTAFEKQVAYNNKLAEINNSHSQSAEYNLLKAQVKTAKDKMDAAKKAFDSAKTLYDTLKERKDSYKTLAAAVKTAEAALENAIIALQKSQKDATVEQTQYNMDLEKAKKEIADLEEKIEKSGEGSTGDTITSPVAGTVTSINISAGSTTEYNVALMVIEEKDRGHMVSFAVTNEQAQKVQIGDSAEVTTNYWGSNIKATLATITNDPANLGKGKILSFTVEGDVSTGDQLNLAIGQKSANYQLIVPNSALRSDANGYFVLTVQSKSSPLGTRYYAARIDVQVVASDDTNTAVSGALVNYDYVITTSSAPISAGDLVRLVEN